MYQLSREKVSEIIFSARINMFAKVLETESTALAGISRLGSAERHRGRLKEDFKVRSALWQEESRESFLMRAVSLINLAVLMRICTRVDVLRETVMKRITCPSQDLT